MSSPSSQVLLGTHPVGKTPLGQSHGIRGRPWYRALWLQSMPSLGRVVELGRCEPRITMKWQYTTLSIPATGVFVGGNVDLGKFTAHLNQLGEVGWELVSVF